MSTRTNLLFFAALGIVILTAYFVYAFNNRAFSYKPGANRELDNAINQAHYTYQLQKSQGVNFKNGPCLTNALIPDWVLDIAHNPRIPTDNLGANQCSALLEGKAHHFVELDPDGNLIRAK